MNTTRKSYPSDVTDAEWEFLLPYLSLMREDAPQREYPLRDLFNAIRYVVRTGCQWRFLPHDLPPWTAVYQQARRWMHAGVFELVAHDLRAIVRFLNERNTEPTATIFDGRTLQSTPESGDRAGYDGAKKKRVFRRICGSKSGNDRAQLRLDRRVLPPTFTIASPRPNEGEAMAKAGGKARVKLEPIKGDRILRHSSVMMELPHFVKTESAPECVSRRTSIEWRSSSRLSMAKLAWRSTTMAQRW
jgi:transposase